MIICERLRSMQWISWRDCEKPPELKRPAAGPKFQHRTLQIHSRFANYSIRTLVFFVFVFLCRNIYTVMGYIFEVMSTKLTDVIFQECWSSSCSSGLTMVTLWTRMFCSRWNANMWHRYRIRGTCFTIRELCFQCPVILWTPLSLRLCWKFGRVPSHRLSLRLKGEAPMTIAEESVANDTLFDINR
jgi:hypothetical protein